MRFRTGLFLVVAAATIAATAELQRPDLASSIFPAVSIPSSRQNAGAAFTGTMVDLANYGSAMAVVNVGRRDSSGNRYAVISDSAAGSAATVHDSVAIDSTDNAQYKIAYRGAKRWVRVTIRATGGTDTTFAGALILRSNARSR